MDLNLEKLLQEITKLPFELFLKAVLILVVGFTAIRIGYRYLSKAVSKSRIDPVLHGVIKQTIKIALQVWVVLTAIESLGVVTTNFTTILGTLGLAVSLAAKDSIADVASGMVILVNKEFTVDDYVEIGAHVGTIQKLTLTYIRMNTKDNRQIFVPNAVVAKSVIINHSREEMRRLDIEIEVPASQDIDEIKRIVLDVVSTSDIVLQKHDTQVVVSDFKLNTTILLLKVWTKTDDYLDLKYCLNEGIRKALQNNSIV